jgi:hypothetical protein
MITPGQRGSRDGGHAPALRAPWARPDGHQQCGHGNHLYGGSVGRHGPYRGPHCQRGNHRTGRLSGERADPLYAVTASGSATVAIWTVTPG